MSLMLAAHAGVVVGLNIIMNLTGSRAGLWSHWADDSGGGRRLWKAGAAFPGLRRTKCRTAALPS